MRIVYLVNDLSHISGGTRVITEHVNRLAKLGHSVEVWTYQKNSKPYFEIKVPVSHMTEKDLSYPDVIVVTDQGFLPLVEASRKRKRTILLLQHDDAWLASVTHNSFYSDLIPAYAAYFQRDDWQIVTVSQWLAKTIEQRYDIACTVVPNGIDTKSNKPSRPLIKPSGPSVLIYNDPQPWKGFELAATAALEARKHIPKLTVLILGAFFPQAMNENGTGNRFTFPATFFCAPDQRDLARIYSSATVFLSASWKEGFGLPALEAMACGTAVVTTDNGGCNEYAKHNDNAFIVPTMNTNALIDGLLTVLTKPALRKRLTENGRKAAKRMDWDNQITALDRLLTGGVSKQVV